MEHFFFSAHFIFSLLLVFFGLSIISFKFLARKHKTSVKLPPGKTGWPIVGETLDFIKLRRKGVPERFIQDRMKIFSPEIFKTGLFGESFAVFCGPTGNKFLFSNENKNVHGWWPKSIHTLLPPSEDSNSTVEAKVFHSLFPKYLSLETLQTYIGTMDSMAKQHFEEDWKNKEEVIVYPLIQNFAFLVACRLFMSVDDPSHVQKLMKPFCMLKAGLISIPINLPGTSFHRAMKGAVYLRKEILSVIKQRKIDLSEKNASPTQDILSHMLHHVDDNGKLMNETDITTKIVGMIFGGHDTTTSTTTLIIKYLGELPDIYEKVRKEQIEIAESKKPGELLNWVDIQKMNYSWNVAKEVLRLASPLQGAFREAITDFTFAGYTIPKGWKLYWNTNSTHKNPEYFPNPEEFDPTRFEGKGPIPYTFVPFGGGPRMCPGREYARLVILVFIHNLVTRHRWENLIPNEKIIYDPTPLPIQGLPIRVQAS